METEKEKTEKEVVLIRTVKGGGGGGMIWLPSFLAGKDIEIRFKRNLTEEEKTQLRINELSRKLRKIREQRRRSQNK